MITIIARYRVKLHSIKEAKKLIREFVTKVKDNEPETLVYESFQPEKDEQEFIHYMKFQTEGAEERHGSAEYTKKFVKVLYPLCERELEFEKLIGFY